MNNERILLICLILVSLGFLVVLIAYTRLKRSRGTFIKHKVPGKKAAKIRRVIKVMAILLFVVGVGTAAFQHQDGIGEFFSAALHPKEVLDQDITVIQHPNKDAKKKSKPKSKPKTRKDGTVERLTTKGVKVWAAPDAKFDPGGKGKLVPLDH